MLQGTCLNTGREVKKQMRIVCQVCSQEGYLQQLGNYFRVRHYLGINPETGKAKFYYHKQSKEHAETQLALKNTDKNLRNQPNNIEHLNNTEHLNLSKSSFVPSGRSLVWLGHQPATLTTRVQIPATAPLELSVLKTAPDLRFYPGC